MKLYYQKIKSDFATLHCYADEENLLGVFFEQRPDAARFFASGEGKVSMQANDILVGLRQQLSEYFGGERRSFEIPFQLTGSELQLAAWNAIRKIPYGQTVSYLAQAQAIGRPAAVRAVASANGRNRFPLIIPCHRVLRSDGSIGGYSGGVALKAKLLELELRHLDFDLKKVRKS